MYYMSSHIGYLRGRRFNSCVAAIEAGRNVAAKFNTTVDIHRLNNAEESTLVWTSDGHLRRLREAGESVRTRNPTCPLT